MTQLPIILYDVQSECGGREKIHSPSSSISGVVSLYALLKILVNRELRDRPDKEMLFFKEILVFWIAKHRSKQMPSGVGCEEHYMWRESN
jgi:hypothetical protein